MPADTARSCGAAGTRTRSSEWSTTAQIACSRGAGKRWSTCSVVAGSTVGGGGGGAEKWGGGNANSQFGVVDDSPDCLQSRCREALVDVQCCGGVHSLWWGGGGIDVRWLNVFRRKGGIARYEGGERAVVESTALTQPGAV